MTKPLFNKVAIVGVGLIGGSLGLAIKKHKLARWVIGSSRTQETIKNAVKVGAIDVGMQDWKEAVADADLVVLAAPVSTIIAQLGQIDSYLKKGAIVIDVGSSKAEIQRVAAKHIKRGRFVGCHPMSGSEKKGILNAQSDVNC